MKLQYKCCVGCERNDKGEVYTCSGCSYGSIRIPPLPNTSLSTSVVEPPEVIREVTWEEPLEKKKKKKKIDKSINKGKRTVKEKEFWSVYDKDVLRRLASVDTMILATLIDTDDAAGNPKRFSITRETIGEAIGGMSKRHVGEHIKNLKKLNIFKHEVERNRHNVNTRQYFSMDYDALKAFIDEVRAEGAFIKKQKKEHADT